MASGVTRTVGRYSYQHNNQAAKYTATLVLNIGSGYPPVRFSVQEKKVQ
jgi:hypothetical protein